MAKNLKAVQDKVGDPSERQIRAAMGKAIRELKRDAEAKKITLAVAGKKAWSVPK